MKRTTKKKKGFTLIELLVVMTIFITIGGVIISILYIALRGNTKTEAVTTVKQNGNFAMSQIIKSIRFARSLDNPVSCVPSNSVNSITVTSLTDRGQTIYRCPANMNSPITSNSAALIDSNAVSVTSCSFTCSQATIADPPRVTIQFTLTARNAGSLPEARSSIPFQSSVIMRNAGR